MHYAYLSIARSLVIASNDVAVGQFSTVCSVHHLHCHCATWVSISLSYNKNCSYHLNNHLSECAIPVFLVLRLYLDTDGLPMPTTAVNVMASWDGVDATGISI